MPKSVRFIQSAENGDYKKLSKLKRSRGRKKEGAFFVESRKLVEEALQEKLPVEAIYLAEHFTGQLPGLSSSIPITRIQEGLFRKLSSLDQPDGILALVRKEKTWSLEALAQQKELKKILVLDRLQDPGNVGALLRSAEAFGYFSVIGIESVDFTNPKVLRASMGSAFRLQLCACSMQEWLGARKDFALPLLAADLAGENAYHFSWGDHLLLVGNEGQGISKEVEAGIDQRITIPMLGRQESLNAAVSASVLMAFSVAFSEKAWDGVQ